MHAVHDWLEPAPWAVAKKPCMQGAQAADVVAPRAVEKVPGWQSAQGPDCMEADEYWPWAQGWHAMLAVAPRAWDQVPGLQALQTLAPVAEPKVPAEQKRHDALWGCPTPVENVPIGHAEQRVKPKEDW